MGELTCSYLEAVHDWTVLRFNPSRAIARFSH
jgi:hypothetical protein